MSDVPANDHVIIHHTSLLMSIRVGEGRSGRTEAMTVAPRFERVTTGAAELNWTPKDRTRAATPIYSGVLVAVNPVGGNIAPLGLTATDRPVGTTLKHRKSFFSVKADLGLFLLCFLLPPSQLATN